MVIDNIRRMTVKGVKLMSESFFLISPGVLELWRENVRGGGFSLPGMDWVKLKCKSVESEEKRAIIEPNAPNGSRDIPSQTQDFEQDGLRHFAGFIFTCHRGNTARQ